MQAEIVLTGSELLLGEIVDTNSVMMAKMLHQIGIDILYKTTVGDDEAHITAVLRHALDRVDLVIVSGGLGPTVDDLTRPAAAAATNRRLIYSEELEAQIAARFASFGRAMGENNKRQAWIPEGAIPVENPVGTAPCFIVEEDQGTIICLPGVPRELKYQLENAVLPYLKTRLGRTQIIKSRTIHTCAIGESDVDRIIGDLMHSGNPTVGLAAHPGQVDVRLTVRADDDAAAEALIAPLEAAIRDRLGAVIYGVDGETLPGVIARLLNERGFELAVVDTLTLGAVDAVFTDAGMTDSLIDNHNFRSVSAALAGLGLSPSLASTAPEELATVIVQKLGDGRPKAISLALLGPIETDEDEALVILALAHGGAVVTHQLGQRYASPARRAWLVTIALDLVRRWLHNHN